MQHFIPEKFYVTRQPRTTNPDEILGFMVPMHKDGYESRKDTADRWAGQSAISPIEVDNVPLEGFSLTANKRRYMNKNVVWRVLHPMGFEFEISSDNFSDFLMEIDMKQGVIQTPMLFIRRKNENYLTYEGSPEHKAAVSQAEIERKVSLKDVNVGDIIKVKDGTQYLYCGAAHSLYLQNPYYRRAKKGEEIKHNTTFDFSNVKSTRSHIVKQIDKQGTISKEYKLESTLKVINILETGRDVPPLTDILDDLRKNIYNDDYNGAIAYHDKPFKISDLEVTLEPHTLGPYKGYQSSVNNLIVAYDGQQYYNIYRYNRSHYGQPQNIEFYLYDTVVLHDLIWTRFSYDASRWYSRWYRDGGRNPVDINNYQIFIQRVKVNK